MSNECSVCKKIFSKHSNLRNHVKKFHPELVDVIAPNKVFKCEAVCKKCLKTFSKQSNLRQHVSKYHPDEIDHLTSPKVYLHPCQLCKKNFSDINHWKNHNKIHLGEENVDKRLRSLKCSLCNNICETKLLLTNHFEQEHDIKILTKTLNFSNENDFKYWKNNLEKKTDSKYVQQSGSSKTLTAVKTVYVCQRSGFYNPKGSAKRHLKTQGSKKINGVCPSEMHVTVLKNGEHKVKFTETHVGHDNDLGHLNLTVAQRIEVAGKIASKIPFSSILDNIRDSVTNDKLERIHLLTRKDLHNITQVYNLNNDSVRHKNDIISIESWIHEVNESGTVVYYKPQSKLCNRYPYLKEEDFMLIIMHPGQLEILQKFSNDCICIDGTHGLNSYNFELTTLMVLDDMREGFPCSFLFSNRSDEMIMQIFFMEIREKLGRQIDPNIFMSDMAPYYYTAWLQTMLPPKIRLFCTWHVDRAWRKNLGKIVGQEQKKNVYKYLRTLLQERDVVAFSNMLNNFVTLMESSSETLEFGNYFKHYYLNNVESWAYCYRLGAGLNTNMHIERMHLTIKYLYFNGKHVKRLDKAINNIMKFIKDKLFERVITMNKGKISSKIKELRQRHKSCEELDINSIVQTEMGWQVPSASSSEIYLVEERNLNCGCKIVCTFCAACLHSYSCTCLDNSIRWNMCKHIHLVCCYRKSIEEYPITVNTPEDEDMQLVIDDSKDDFMEENKRLIQILSKGNSGIAYNSEEQLFAEKEKLRTSLNKLVDKISSFEELETVKKITAAVDPTLLAIKNKTEEKIPAIFKYVPHNKSIVQQPRLFSTKKKTGKRDHQKLTKPSSRETDSIAVQLLNVDDYNN